MAAKSSTKNITEYNIVDFQCLIDCLDCLDKRIKTNTPCDLSKIIAQINICMDTLLFGRSLLAPLLPMHYTEFLKLQGEEIISEENFCAVDLICALYVNACDKLDSKTISNIKFAECRNLVMKKFDSWHSSHSSELELELEPAYRIQIADKLLKMKTYGESIRQIPP